MKKMTKKDFAAIGYDINRIPKRERFFFNWYMDKEDDYCYHFVKQIKWRFFIPLYIPATIFCFFACLWDGGLRDFELQSRYAGCDEIVKHKEKKDDTVN